LDRLRVLLQVLAVRILVNNNHNNNFLSFQEEESQTLNKVPRNQCLANNHNNISSSHLNLELQPKHNSNPHSLAGLDLALKYNSLSKRHFKVVVYLARHNNLSNNNSNRCSCNNNSRFLWKASILG
jgi:hypothetical protein